MKRRALISIASIFISAVAGAQSTDISVMSWNIRRAVGANSPNTSQQAYISKIVNYLNPDVWNINELGGNARGYSASSEKAVLVSYIVGNISIFGSNPVEGRDFYVYVGSANDGYIGNAIVSRYALQSATTYSDGLRGLVHADVQLPNGAVLGDFTTHLKATTDSTQSTTDSTRRQEEADSSSSTMKGWLSTHQNTSAVLTGDFNLSEDPGEEDNWAYGNIGDQLPNGEAYHPISTLKGAGFLDGVPLSYNGDKDTISSGSSNPKNRFDYNLFSNQGDVSYLGGQVFNTAAIPQSALPSGMFFSSSGYASDHLPVLARYRIGSVPEPTTSVVFAASIIGLLRRRR